MIADVGAREDPGRSLKRNASDMSVDGYWGPRSATVEEATTLLLDFMRGVGTLGPPVDRMFVARNSPRQELIPWVDDIALAERLVLKGRMWSDTRPREVMADGGYSVMFDQNLRQRWSASVNVSVGVTSPWLDNRLGIDLGPGLGHDDAVERRLLDALELIIRIGRPEFAVVRSAGIRDLLPWNERGDFMLGWITYVSGEHLSTRPALPSIPGRVERRDDGSVLIRLTSEWFDHEREDHRTTLRMADEALLRVGVYRRKD